MLPHNTFVHNTFVGAVQKMHLLNFILLTTIFEYTHICIYYFNCISNIILLIYFPAFSHIDATCKRIFVLLADETFLLLVQFLTSKD